MAKNPVRLIFEGLSSTATAQLAQALAQRCRNGDVLALIGTLGSGKTTFARAFIRQFDVTDDIPSPTFTLMQSYEGCREGRAVRLSHFDFYRIENELELEELGIHDAMERGITLIEWPEKAAGFVPEDTLLVRIDFHGEKGQRRITLEGNETWQKRLAGLKVVGENG